MTSHYTVQQCRDFCAALSEADDAMARELVSRVADKWSLWVLEILATASAPLRFTRVLEQVEGISQKSLTKTLRQLERDGLLTRTMFLELPPRVEYAITPIGMELLEQVMPLWMWGAQNLPIFRAARQRYDAQQGKSNSAPSPPGPDAR